MSEALNKIQSVLEEIERIKKPHEPRRSLFEDPNQTKQAKEKNCAFLEEWNHRWGKHNYDYVYTVQHPEEYLQKVKEDREICLNGLTELIKRSGSLLDISEDFILILTEEILKADQHAYLQNIHFQINKYISDATLFLKEVEIYQKTQQIKLKGIEHEIDNFNVFNC